MIPIIHHDLKECLKMANSYKWRGMTKIKLGKLFIIKLYL